MVTRLSNNEYFISLGTTVRRLRNQHGLNQAALAQRAQLSNRQLSQIEHGEACADDDRLGRIANALGIEHADLWRAIEKTHVQREQLRDFLKRLAIPVENWHEFLALEPDVLAQVVARLQAQVPARIDILKVVDDVSDEIERSGLGASIGAVVDGIRRHGLTPIDYLRSAVRMEELAGERIVFTDRIPLSPTRVPVDELTLFRAIYGVDPSNPTLLRWWSSSRRSAVLASIQTHRSRTIVGKDQIERYIRAGQRGPNIVLPLAVVEAHIRAMITLLRSRPNFMLGLSEQTFPITYRAKIDQLVIASRTGYERETEIDENRMMLCFTRPSVTRQFLAHFDANWAQIPTELRANDDVAEWLEARLVENIGQA